MSKLRPPPIGVKRSQTARLKFIESTGVDPDRDRDIQAALGNAKLARELIEDQAKPYLAAAADLEG